MKITAIDDILDSDRNLGQKDAIPVTLAEIALNLSDGHSQVEREIKGGPSKAVRCIDRGEVESP